MVEDVINVVSKNFGLGGVIILLILLIILRYPAEVKGFIVNMRYNEKNRSSLNKLKNLFLSKIDYLMSVKINALNINDPCRQKIFKDILYLELKQVRELVNDFDPKIALAMPSEELLRCFLLAYNDVVRGYEQEAEDWGIPRVVLDKYARMQYISYNRVITIVTAIFTNSPNEPTLHKMKSIYYILESSFELSFNSALETLKQLNGELDGVVYKGLVCESRHH